MRTGTVSQVRPSSDGTDDGSITTYSYGFDSHGNLQSRSDAVAGGGTPYTENLCYDQLNRLINSSLRPLGGTSCTAGGAAKVYGYDDLGNITSKPAIGTTGNNTYSYPAFGPSAVRPHAVASITGTVNGTVNPNYKYDANGNLTCIYTSGICGGSSAPASSYRHTAANMVSRVVQGTVTIRLDYDSEHMRIAQHVIDGSAGPVDTTYLNDPMSGAASELEVQGASATWHDYLTADGRMVGERFTTGAASSWNWFVLDHLGSVTLITDQAKQVVINGWLSYDAWGRMRNADGTDDASCNKPDLSPSTRGFTGQEQMPGVCLINLNARIYDPTLGKFLTPDSVVQSIYGMQLLNRYSYVGNNPLSLTDPTGNVFGIDDILLTVLAVGIVAAVEPQLLGDLAPIFAAIACGPWGPLCAAAASAAVTGIQGGSLGDVLSAFMLTGAQAGMMSGLGSPNWAAPASVGAYAIGAGMIGGMFSAGQSGNFASGFLAAGIGSLSAGLTGPGITPEGLVTSAVLGGLASVAGGGKFANGAVTGAFAYAAASAMEEAQDSDGDTLTAPTRWNGTIDRSQWPTPPGSVLATPEEDQWAIGLAKKTYISSTRPQPEIADGLTASGKTLVGRSLGNSASECPGGTIACFHIHGLEDFGGGVLGRSAIRQDYRLNFGPGDEVPLMSHRPNYMLNFNRELQVLEYTAATGYTNRSFGIIPYQGPQ